MRKFIFACLLLANLKEKSSKTTSEFSVIDEKLSLSIVKLAGRNENPETFWKSVGPAVWTYTEILKGKDISYWWD